MEENRTVTPISSKVPESKVILVDTDPGGDDAWALFMAIKAHNDPTIPIRIVAITTTYGNTDLDHATNNTTRVLKTVLAKDIPVYRGAKNPLVIPFVNPIVPPFFGEDGFGDANLPPIQSIYAPGHAVNIMISLAEQYQENLTVVALGPLTNLALAIRLKPEIKFREIFILGGNIHGVGNTTATAEFNFFADPGAAKVTLENYKCPIFLLPWETDLNYAFPKSFRIKKLGELRTPEIQLLNAVEAKLLASSQSDKWDSPDASLMAWVINPKVVTKTEIYYCTVEINGTLTRGMMVVDRDGYLKRKPNVRFATELDISVLKRMLKWAGGGRDYRLKEG